MALDAGTKLGPYEIVAQLGAGGMGEVYKATDTRLNRTVAIKVLPPHFTDDPEMRQRFEREAQTIASLNHPHICTLFDVGRQDDLDFLVMEFLEGETLAQRLAKGPLPLEEAMKVAIAIADGLDKAHEQGVTHRDLKPGNVMLTKTGAKLLDFGLAKAAGPAQVAGAPGSGSGQSKAGQSPRPNMLVPAGSATRPITAQGMILGTLQYMAPEQLEGKEADARSDIFAFGAVLYEMVTGRKAFEGKSQPHLIAAIMSVDTDPVSKTVPAVPPALDFLVKRCLAKDPDQRLQTATDLVWELQWIAGGAEGSAPLPSSALRSRRTRIAQLSLVAASLLAAVMLVLAFRSPGDVEAREETRFLINVPDMPTLEAVSISPDGRWVAFSARDASSTAVFVRPIGSEAPQKLVGTEGAGRLFWSPDSRWIAFFANGTLKKIEAAGGPPQNICETPDLLGGTWNADDVIVFGSSKGLQRVQAVGGEPTLIEAGDQAAQNRREPYFLPDGDQYLYLAGSADGSDSAIYAGSLGSTDATRLVAAQSNPVYAEPGYLLFHRQGTLYAQSFNPRSLALSGEAVRIADKIPFGSTGAAAFGASNTGLLIFRNDPQAQAGRGGSTAGTDLREVPLVWVNASGGGRTGGTGRGNAQAAPAARWAGVDLSPDGKRTAVHRHEADGGDIWIFEAGQSTPSRFTFDATQDNSNPIWSPDGSKIAFGSRRNSKWGLYVKQADNARSEELVLESDLPTMPMSWSGDRLVYWSRDPKTAGDIWSISANPAASDKKPVPILQTQADERNAQVSPDGKWIAYSSNQTGRSEIYINPFPEGPGRIQVSVNGGVFPRWRRDGRQLYFMSVVSLGGIMASDIRVTGSSVQRDVPRPLFQTLYVTGTHSGGQHHAYAVSADGEQFLIPQFETIQAVANIAGPVAAANAAVATVLATVAADRNAGTFSFGSSTTPITVVVDWTAGLRR
ncbi:MAG TPA: protein kinase [Vicinamibacterales bacterium]|nr:protein kinase [Vicinamibacterales bacterium]